jgi:hypothetical protein
MAVLRTQCVAVLAFLAIAFGFAGQFVSLAEANLYNEDIVHAESSPYQRIVVTRWRDEMRLYLNHNLQFSSRDEYRYHEALVHPGLAALPGARRVLVLGGGDGMAVREILKYPQVESITLVDLDPRMTELFAQSPMLRDLNGNSLGSPKLKVINADALQWLEQSQEVFDFVVVDFPDPSNHSLGKLYSTAFYRLLKQHVAETGLHRGAGHLADVCAGELLDRGRVAGSGRLADRALPRAGAELRRMGLHSRRPARLQTAGEHPGGDALRHARRAAGAVPLPDRHGARFRPNRTGSTTRTWCGSSSGSGAGCRRTDECVAVISLRRHLPQRPSPPAEAKCSRPCRRARFQAPTMRSAIGCANPTFRRRPKRAMSR